MIERVIDLSEEGAELSVSLSRLVIRCAESEVTVPLAEIAALIVTHPAVRYTHAVLTGIAAHGGSVVLCNEKRLPAAMLLPLEANWLQAGRFAQQAAAPLPTKKKLWKQLVRAKVIAQARLLMRVAGDDCGLLELAKRVRSGDSTNIEAQASRRYWPALFGAGFSRDPDGGGVNSLLNYGYAVLRALVARAICAAGLHPSLGLHHHNRYDPFCLADDLMEPFRPVVDEVVSPLAACGTVLLDKASKRALIGALTGKRFELEGESRTLFAVLERLAWSLGAVFARERSHLLLP